MEYYLAIKNQGVTEYYLAVKNQDVYRKHWWKYELV